MPTKKFVGGVAGSIPRGMFEAGVPIIHAAARVRRSLARVLRGMRGALLVACVAAALAQEARPLLAPGATKDEVIDAYGWPTGQSRLGAKEVLSYPQGRVILEDGLVDKIDFTMKPPWPPPRPRPDWATPVAKPVDPLAELWLSRYEDALHEATTRGVRVLALVTTSEGPAARHFDEAVARQPEFHRTFAADFVFLRLDCSPRAALPVEVREQHQRLREQMGVTALPALRILAANGDVLAPIGIAAAPGGEVILAEVTAAVAQARDQVAKRLAVAGVIARKAALERERSEAKEAKISTRSLPVESSLFTAQRVVVWAVAIGVTIAVILFWLVWRNWASSRRSATEKEITMRISDAASGLPSQLDLVTWPHDRLVALVAAYVEAEGYHPELQPAASDKDIVLRRADSRQPQVIIKCAGSEVGVVPTKRVREFFATMTADGVDTGWYVAPAGFAADVKPFAEQHRVQIIDGPGLIAQLRELPPLVLPKVMAKVAAK